MQTTILPPNNRLLPIKGAAIVSSNFGGFGAQPRGRLFHYERATTIVPPSIVARALHSAPGSCGTLYTRRYRVRLTPVKSQFNLHRPFFTAHRRACIGDLFFLYSSFSVERVEPNLGTLRARIGDRSVWRPLASGLVSPDRAHSSATNSLSDCALTSPRARADC